MNRLVGLVGLVGWPDLNSTADLTAIIVAPFIINSAKSTFGSNPNNFLKKLTSFYLVAIIKASFTLQSNCYHKAVRN